MRKVIVETTTGLVVNVVELEDGADWSPPEGHEVLDAGPGAEPGGTWDRSAFAPAVVVDQNPGLTALRAKLVDDTATFADLKKMLRLERSMEV